MRFRRSQSPFRVESSYRGFAPRQSAPFVAIESHQPGPQIIKDCRHFFRPLQRLALEEGQKFWGRTAITPGQVTAMGPSVRMSKGKLGECAFLRSLLVTGAGAGDHLSITLIASRASPSTELSTTMKINALRTFVCPVSKGELSLVAFEEHDISLTPSHLARAEKLKLAPAELTRAVRTGILYCKTSRKWYPIVNYIPLLIDYGTDIHREFVSKYQSQSTIFREYELPDSPPRPGEDLIRKTFTKQWATLQLDSISFGYTPEQRDFFVRLELDWPEFVMSRADLRLLEVGCGSGFESLSLDRVTQADVYGVDLNVTLLRNGAELVEHPFVNLASASLYALPFRTASFDVVYSSGVLHHTHSTRAAFEEIMKYRQPEGLIYIWVYAAEDFDRTIYRRFNWLVEAGIRPKLAALPDFWQGQIVRQMSRLHYSIYKRRGRLSKEHWTLADSEHAIRDRWTPLFAHRHLFNDVIEWFLDHGLEYKLIDPKKYREYFKTPLIGIGVRGVPAEVLAAQASRRVSATKGSPEPVHRDAG